MIDKYTQGFENLYLVQERQVKDSRKMKKKFQNELRLGTFKVCRTKSRDWFIFMTNRNQTELSLLVVKINGKPGDKIRLRTFVSLDKAANWLFRLGISNFSVSYHCETLSNSNSWEFSLPSGHYQDFKYALIDDCLERKMLNSYDASI
ncbi:hypothetical protein G6699_06275 [Polynucleobacter paneuropaeus]|jgi:hypothetical protein|nr:hypothetical protein [Polynucleobacter paneuropaeus]